VRNILHRLAHLFGYNYGTCFAFYDGPKLMMGFKCSTCGDVAGVHQVDPMIHKDIAGYHDAL